MSSTLEGNCQLQNVRAKFTGRWMIAANHEEAEQLERAIVKDFRNDLKGHKERLQQSHRVRNMLEIMQERAKKLVGSAKVMHTCSMLNAGTTCNQTWTNLRPKQIVFRCHPQTLCSNVQEEVYKDEDSSRKDDIASLKVEQGDFKVFYDRVRDLKDFYRNRPIEVTEVSVELCLSNSTHDAVAQCTMHHVMLLAAAQIYTFVAMHCKHVLQSCLVCMLQILLHVPSKGISAVIMLHLLSAASDVNVT